MVFPWTGISFLRRVLSLPLTLLLKYALSVAYFMYKESVGFMSVVSTRHNELAKREHSPGKTLSLRPHVFFSKWAKFLGKYSIFFYFLSLRAIYVLIFIAVDPPSCWTTLCKELSGIAKNDAKRNFSFSFIYAARIILKISVHCTERNIILKYRNLKKELKYQKYLSVLS